MQTADMAAFLREHQLTSPDDNPITEPKDFNILFETGIGAIAGEKSVAYLRGETAQGIFTNFKQILNSSRANVPFGVGQMGKSFRNEITTGQFVFRTLEFEQAEVEYFFDPDETPWQPLFQQWQEDMWRFITKRLGIRAENLRWRRHSDRERSHYSTDTYDLDYHYPFGWKELWGIIEIGTPFCITVDYQTLEEQTVTVRKRDDASQERVSITQLSVYLQDQINAKSYL